MNGVRLEILRLVYIWGGFPVTMALRRKVWNIQRIRDTIKWTWPDWTISNAGSIEAKQSGRQGRVVAIGTREITHREVND